MKKTKNSEIKVLIEDYKRIYSYILQYTKLQYQLVAIAYSIAGAALTFWGSSANRLLPVAILYLPPIFCGLVLVQLYLHSQIKSCSRYINFRLRPRIEELLINNNHKSPIHPIWSWEEYYVESHYLIRFFMRQLGSIIIFSVYLLAIGPILIFVQQTTWVNSDKLWFTLDIIITALTLALIVIVKSINEQWWKVEKSLIQKNEGPTQRSPILFVTNKHRLGLRIKTY